MADLIHTLAISGILGLVLLIYMYLNKEQKIERYYIKQGYFGYLPLKYSYFVIITAFVFNIRYIILNFAVEKLKELANNLQK